MGPTIAIIAGYALNAIGTILMVRYGLPYRLPILGLLLRTLTEKESGQDDGRKALGFLGLILLLLGTALQIVSTALGSGA